MPKAAILVVDDEKNILSTLSRARRVEDFDVDVAGSAEIALEKVRTRAYDAFLTLMRTKGDTASVMDEVEEVLEDAVAFEGVSKYPARIKCALLGWMAWKDATAQALENDDRAGDMEETA